MEFKYKAKKSLNEIIEGKIEAENLAQAVEKLGLEGITPIVVEPDTNETILKREPAGSRLGRWGSKKVTLFTQKLYNLTKSNVELLAALKLLQQENSDPTEKLLLGDIIKNIKEGQTLSQCLSRYPRYFSFLYINIVRAGESSGQLKDALGQLLSYLQRLQELRMKVRQALAYPIFMIVVGLLTIFVMLTFVLPRLVNMFEDFQATLPLPTRILLAVSNALRRHWIVMVIFLFFILQRRYVGKGNLFSYVKYRLPLVRELVYKQTIANFSMSLSLLLKSGVDLLTALGITAPIVDNPKYIVELQQVRQDIKEGASFSQALAKFKIFPPFFIQMIKVGEEGGRLDSILADIADSFQQEIESDLKIISSLLEPAIILILGLIIGGMVIAVLLPIFNINALVGG